MQNAKLVLILLPGSLGCFALADDEVASPSQPVSRCSTVMERPDVSAILADDDPALSNGHAHLEALAQTEFPTNLAFTPGPEAEASKASFRAFFAALTENAQQAQLNYRSIVDGHASLASRRRACAAALTATELVIYELQAAPLPSGFEDHEYAEEIEHAYCDALDDAAKPAREARRAWQKRCERLNYNR